MVRDMTSGSPMKIITMFAVPMFVEMCFSRSTIWWIPLWLEILWAPRHWPP